MLFRNILAFISHQSSHTIDSWRFSYTCCRRSGIHQQHTRSTAAVIRARKYVLFTNEPFEPINTPTKQHKNCITFGRFEWLLRDSPRHGKQQVGAPSEHRRQPSTFESLASICLQRFAAKQNKNICVNFLSHLISTITRPEWVRLVLSVDFAKLESAIQIPHAAAVYAVMPQHSGRNKLITGSCMPHPSVANGCYNGVIWHALNRHVGSAMGHIRSQIYVAKIGHHP